jgi:hypothetical protein
MKADDDGQRAHNGTADLSNDRQIVVGKSSYHHQHDPLGTRTARPLIFTGFQFWGLVGSANVAGFGNETKGTSVTGKKKKAGFA